MFSYKALRQAAAAAILGFSVTTVTTGCDTLTDMIISDAQEVELGVGVDKEIFSEYSILADSDPVAIWANELVQNLVPASREFRNPSGFGGYKVKVIYDNNMVNAFAAPGGFVYIVSGLVLESADCAQVAGVVGHELSHVTQRHSIKQIAKQAAVIGLADIVLDDGITKTVAENLWVFLQNTTFSRKNESEADKVGTQIMHDTGYNPYALAHMFQKLAELDKGNEPPKFLSSHPLSGDRAKAIREQIESTWPEQVQEDDDSALTYGCLLPSGSTSPDFNTIRDRLNSGTVVLDPRSNQNPAPPTP